jgi:ATP-dependent DNA helicase RecG
VPPVNAQILAENKRIVARSYRNRRVGDFLKELHLTEGRGTGIPTIRRAMNRNNSSEPIFETDDQSTYFLTVLPVNPEISDVVSNQESNQMVTILSYCLTPKSRKELLSKIDLSNQTKNYQRHIEPLVTKNLLRMTILESPKNRNQRYVTNQKGKESLNTPDRR